MSTDNELLDIKQKLLLTCPKNNSIYKYIESIGINKKRPLGKINVAYWTLEITRGCNLRCGFCATRNFPIGQYKFMTIKTWEKIINMVSIITPYNRIDFANAGEPTLNPNIKEILKIGREKSPHTFFEIITNGVLISQGKITYKELFDAGANMIYVDMYSSKEKHIELAKKSGYEYYVRGDKDSKDKPVAWTYHSDSNMKIIVFQENPANWNKSKKNTCGYSTFMNNLDWEEAKKYNIFPVKKAVSRRCQQPFRTGNISFDGFYSFCCFDFVRNIYGKIGNVDEGLIGFFNFWLGKYMQITRKLLHNKDRNGHELCSKCNFCSGRADIPCWEDNTMDFYWENNKWNKNKIIPNIVKSKVSNLF
jgi:organic radical activating enzyme